MKDIFQDFVAPQGAEVSIIPVMQGDGMIQIDQDQLPDSLPILALRNAVLFPGTVYPITIGREKSIRLKKTIKFFLSSARLICIPFFS